MIKCTRCRIEKDESFFISEKKKLLKTCNHCREKNKVFNKIWKDNNKERIKLYNEAYRNNNVHEWEDIKIDKKITEKCKGQPSKHRVLHETKDNVIGKKCCSCKEWKPLTDYNNLKSHWDNLRNDCKDCLVIWRKNNRSKLNENHKIYEKDRKKIDPQFKLMKTLRSRLNNALKRKSAEKCASTMELIGCSVNFLKKYIEDQFEDGMTWENHGLWHIDHRKPCSSFNLTEEQQQKECFHYTNLQPLWAKDNLSKGSKDPIIWESLNNQVIE